MINYWRKYQSDFKWTPPPKKKRGAMRNSQKHPLKLCQKISFFLCPKIDNIFLNVAQVKIYKSDVQLCKWGWFEITCTVPFWWLLLLQGYSIYVRTIMIQDFFVYLFENKFLLQGPMWRQIRGQGLAYGYNMYPVVSKGLLYITLYRATHPVKAYTEARRIAVSLFFKRQISK